jgi:hypothetical protein
MKLYLDPKYNDADIVYEALRDRAEACKLALDDDPDNEALAEELERIRGLIFQMLNEQSAWQFPKTMPSPEKWFQDFYLKGGQEPHN